MHAAIYSKREDVRAVVHSHNPATLALASVIRASGGSRMGLVTVECRAILGEHVPILGRLRAGSEELAERVSEALRGAEAVVLEDHGVVAVGRDLWEAVSRAEALEEEASYRLLRICAAGLTYRERLM